MKVILHIILLVILAGCNYKGSSITDPPVGIGAQEPSLIVTDQGLVLSWQEPYEGDILLKMALHDGLKWSPAITIAKGDDWFVNWADFPAIIANGDKLFVHFLQKSSESMLAYNAMFLISPDMGETWSAPKQLHQDTVTAEHGFVSGVPYEEGFYVSWLDGRNTIGIKGNFTLRGGYVTSDGALLNSAEIDDNTCTCCQTTMTIINNVPFTFYRDRSEEEIRDISYAKLVDGNWSEPQRFNEDNWLIPGCPVNGPVAKSYANTMAVAWFTGANGENKVKLKISADAGNTFGDEILVDGSNAIGRVDVQMDSTKIYVTFIGATDNGTAVRLKVYDYSGELQDTEVIASVSAERGTGFPRTAIWNDNLIISWTDVEQHSVKIIQYPLNKEHISAGTRGY
jgi:hypothetical protein